MHESLFIDDLCNHRDYIREIARWQFDAWGPLTGAQTYEGYVDFFDLAVRSQNVPLVLVAVLEGTLRGSVNLVACDMKIRRGLTPWLGQLFVLPSFRNQSVGRALVEATAKRAKALGYPRLYLYTSGDLPRYYERLGWVVNERVEYLGKERTVMHYDTLPPGINA